MKHRTIEMWCAWMSRGRTKALHYAKVMVVETAKQYRVDEQYMKDNRVDLSATGYRRCINKDGNDCLFESPMAALKHLQGRLEQQEKLATARANDAQEDLFLVTEEISDLEKKIAESAV